MAENLMINETYAVDVTRAVEWRNWMVEHYIPQLMESGLCKNYVFSAVENGETQGAQSFALQFIVQNKDDVQKFISELDPPLKQKLNRNFAGGYASFVTVLNIISKQ